MGDTTTLRDLETPLVLAMAQHVSYVSRVGAAINGEDDFTGTSADDCALGRAINEFTDLVRHECPEGFKQTWTTLISTHQTFHDTAARALDRRREADLMESEMLSLRVVDLLGSLGDHLQTL